VSGQRVAEVLVEVGAQVTADQPLLRLDTRSLAMARRQSEAGVAQADAQLVVARANAKRAAELRERGLVSARDAEEAWAAEENAKAQHRTASAALAAARLQVDFAELRAPDAGVISWRGVQPGQVVMPGAELLRLIRQGRLEWRAELSERELIRIAAGAVAVLRGPDGSQVQGTVRQVSPALDPVSRTGLVYVDLPAPGALRAGMFAQGELRLGEVSARTVPHAAVVERDGYRYVFVLGEGGVVAQRRVETGARDGDVVEIREGLADGERIALEGAAFLSDGDRVKVVEEISGEGRGVRNE
jgi:RND family efflux transporter MFP subunit